MKLGGTDGNLGVDPILWRLRMQYPWSDQMAAAEPDWDQCCTCHVVAISESEARSKVWQGFQYPGAVKPEAIASCVAVKFAEAAA